MSSAVQRPAVASRTDARVAPPAEPQTLLEGDFPFAEVSALARRDRYCVDHTYAVHKWWARRPPAVIRALLIAAFLPAHSGAEEFWRDFSADSRPLAGKVIGDPFMGGATSLVEASRLGADVTGVDVDPLAVRVARVELDQLDRERFEAAAASLLTSLEECHETLYPGEETPLHYFWLREASCGRCGESALVHRDRWLVRDRGLPGAVVRDEGGVAFCPSCRGLHRIASDRKVLRCCGRQFRLDRGTYTRGRFHCPACGHAATNDNLKIGSLPLRLIAVEQTIEGARRTLREPGAADLAALGEAAGATAPEPLLESSLAGVDAGRPASYGFESVADLFHPRQLLVLGDAFAWIRNRGEPRAVTDALTIAISNAIGSNNALCGYATDYGRLSSLFSGVRAYSVPVLSVELNPLHPTAGRGTLAATLRRVARSAEPKVRRHAIDADGAIESHEFSSHGGGRRAISCQSADRPLPTKLGRYDLVLTDPPYFDFIPYSDLSLLYRAWLAPESGAEKLGGAPIFPVGEDAEQQFSERLARAFANARRALQAGSALVFTFHSPHERAWRALERALRGGGFAVHAIFPLWADGRSGSHGHAGNCEWDLVFVCRAAGHPRPALRATIEGWQRQLGGERLEQSDLNSMALGLEMARNLGS